MARDLTIRYLGHDSSGRGLYMTQWMLDVLNAIKRHPLVESFAWKIVPVQGAFMLKNGGGASDSSGFHNYGGCLDIRTWNLTTDEINRFVRAARMLGFGFWRRDYTWRHGAMAPHAHGTLGSDGYMGSLSSISWSSYLRGGDGLAGSGGDYEWRPVPLVLYPPAELMQGDWLMSDDAKKILDKLDKLQRGQDSLRAGSFKRDQEIIKQVRDSKERMVDVMGRTADRLVELENMAQDDATKKQVKALRDTILQALADDPAVDRQDNPSVEGLAGHVGDEVNQ